MDDDDSDAWSDHSSDKDESAQVSRRPGRYEDEDDVSRSTSIHCVAVCDV